MRMGTYLVVKRMCCAPAAMLRCAVHSTVVLCCCCPLRCSAVMAEFPLAAVMEAALPLATAQPTPLPPHVPPLVDICDLMKDIYDICGGIILYRWYYII
jgi:hypothetical protein